LISIAKKINLSTKEHPVEKKDRPNLKESLEEFKILCLDFIIPLAKCYQSTAWL
jgi:hypothetical protein